MSTRFDPQSSSESWRIPSTWVLDATQDSPSTSTPHSDRSSETTRVTGAGPASTSTFTLSALSSSPTVLMVIPSSSSPSPLITTQTSQTGSTGQNLKGTAVTFRTGHIVAVSIITFVVPLAMAGLFIYLLIRVRVRKLGHQRLYSYSDENFDGDSPNMAFLGNTGRNGGGEPFGVGALRGRTREFTPQVSGWYLRTSSLGLKHESPTVQSRSSVPIVEEAYGPLSPLEPPRYSQIQPNIRPPRPLPVPRNPRPLLPQRRVDSIQVRKQNKPPLISGSTTLLPLPSFPLSSAPSSTRLRSTGQGLGAVPVPENFPPLLPQRRIDSTQAPLSSWSFSNPSLSPLAPLRPTPAISFKHIPPNQTSYRFHRFRLRNFQKLK